MLNSLFYRHCLLLAATPLVLMFSQGTWAAVDLGPVMTNNCSTAYSTIQILDDMLSQSQLPIYFDANCGAGGTGPDGQQYQNFMDVQMTVSAELQPINAMSIGYELTNDCADTVSTLNLLNNLLAKQGLAIYMSSQCGPGGTATNGQYYNNSVPVNLNVNAVIEAQ